jgi:hypothetical protein
MPADTIFTLNARGNLFYDAFAESVQPVRDIEFGHPEQFFIVYINNLSDGMFDGLCRALKPYDAFVGYADAN